MQMQNKKTRDGMTYLFFILPALLLFTVFFIVPFLRSFALSFTDAFGFRKDIHFIGLANFIEALSRDTHFMTCLWVTVRYTAFVVIAGNLFSLALALMLDTRLPGRNVLRTVFFLPNVMSLIIVGFVWTFLYGDVYRSLIHVLGDPSWMKISWLGNTDLAVFSIGLTAIWQSAGYAMIIYIAGLQGIPAELIEAAHIDGAGEWAILYRIKLPLMAPVVLMNLILATTTCLKAFDFPYAMTSGGPGYATTTLALYIYTLNFSMHRTGYATAVSMILFFLIAVVTVFMMKDMKLREDKI